MSHSLQKIVNEVNQMLNKLYGERLVRVLLFGSQARGDAVEGSDIDVMVVLNGEVSPGTEISKTGEMTSELSLKYDVVVSCTFISQKRFENEKSPLLLNVHKEGIPV